MMNRRQVLGVIGTAAAAGVVQSRPRAVYGYPANEAIRVGCIGTGGRCRVLMKSLKNVPGVTMTAVCDVWDVPLNLAKPLAEANAFATKDYRAVLDRKEVDAVLVGTPDHWHVPITVDACAAGKDVYVEKPLTHGLAEGQAVIDAQNKHKRVVQVGTQQRSMPHLIKAREIVQAGTLDEIHKAHLTNWVECMRSRQKPHVPAEAGVAAAAGAHLGNMAYRSGQVARWKDAVK